MNKILFLVCIISMCITSSLHAQRIVWQDDFETSKGWSEYEDNAGSAMVTEGTLKIKSKDGWIFYSKCKTNLDGNKNFTITADANIKSGLKEGRHVGIVFDYYDKKNYLTFFVEKGFVWFEQRKNGQLIRQDKEPIKNRSRKDTKRLSFEVRRTGQTAIFVVNDEEAIEIDGIEVHSNRVGFFVSGDQEVSFDNIKITQ